MKSNVTKQFFVTIILIFVLQTVMLTYIFHSFYKSAENNIMNLGESNLKSQATTIENYLSKGRDVLWFAADSVDYMVRSGADDAELLDYLTVETYQMQNQFDENFTGIYGYLRGSYIDGAGWAPPDDFVPTERSWYIEAKEAGGEMILSAPYQDAQTGKIVISFSQLLSDGESVISMDIVLDEVQNIIEQMSMSDVGYDLILDSEGLVVAHYDRSEVGKNYSQDSEMSPFMDGIRQNHGGEFQIDIDGEPCTVFSRLIDDEWYVVVVARNAQLFRELRRQLLAGVSISILVLLIIVGFCAVSVRRISAAEESEQESMDRLKSMNLGVIRSLAFTIDAKDRYTSGHSQRVADYAVMIAKKMGMSEEDLEVIYNAGLLHDVGKIRVSEEVINKPGRLDRDEFDQIKIHPVSGYHILRDIQDDERIGYASKYHHERYDGMGYPNGLKGDNIPEVARIIAVADAYDAMASDRSYRKLLPQNVIRDEISRGKGTQFDPRIADIMLDIIDEDKDYSLRQKEETEKNVLVVDDEKMIIRIVEHMLSKMDKINTFSAMDAKETMEILRNNRIDLILLDLRIPDTDGFTLYQQIRAVYDIPVILMTGDRSLETVQRIRVLGIDDYLTKPLDAAVTKETVHGILHRNSGGER